MNDRITTDTPFGEAFNIIFHALATDKGDDFATFGLSFYRKGDIRHINVRMYSETVTSKNVIEKGHAHCTWTEQFYPTACCMDINTLLEYIEKGEAVKPVPRRTFEEIVNELVGKPEIKATFPVLRKYKNGEVDLANHKDDRTITIWPNGDTNFLGLSEITAAQLAAISAACTEIAANYAAEHGKEEHKNG